MDVKQIDTDGDGQPDVEIRDTNNDGITDSVAYDTDGDGVSDYHEYDNDRDGVVDSTSGTNHVSSAQASAVAANHGVDTVNVDLGGDTHHTSAPAQSGDTQSVPPAPPQLSTLISTTTGSTTPGRLRKMDG